LRHWKWQTPLEAVKKKRAGLREGVVINNSRNDIKYNLFTCFVSRRFLKIFTNPA
jgi:hypothetical protein